MIYFHQLSISSVSFADNLCNYRIPSAERNTRKTKIKTKKTKTASFLTLIINIIHMIITFLQKNKNKNQLTFL